MNPRYFTNLHVESSTMKTPIKILIVTAFAVTVVAAVVLKQPKCPAESKDGTAVTMASASDGAKVALPRLVDLGVGKCIPCKKMAPILEELKKEYAGRMEVEFIDV
jgi:thioredoxin 1